MSAAQNDSNSTQGQRGIGCLALVIGAVVVLGVAALVGGTDTSSTASCTTNSSVVDGVVPDVTQRRLNEAEDALCQAGFSNVTSQDAVPGSDRLQLVDSNWFVVSQDPLPGTETALAASITLGVVKEGEPGAPASVDSTPATFVVGDDTECESARASDGLVDAYSYGTITNTSPFAIRVQVQITFLQNGSSYPGEGMTNGGTGLVYTIPQGGSTRWAERGVIPGSGSFTCRRSISAQRA